ncbi:unnamed protein product [Rotaria sordida]|uniref:C2H2-type domain-containing protein n=1 Tax=Rotaria sordida TaxID=392033 RepID=A0A813W5V4_9BILA|nr:unnamed protein product [Rotaria sordida]CAF0824504.1 unnamed protein product [Rotaria sordida]CAF0846083.1 unnamed protein product [Rotaria sordida]CAF0852842.1 unnamed protein product [Rotaria sordida]CAF3688156.1 unnamed protein product [Rotaria sordida]
MNTNDFQASVFVSSNQQKTDKRPDKSSKQTDTIDKQITKPMCTRCGTTQLIDITQHEFPKQKGLVFECMSCGNNSLRSNVSDDERQRRLAMVAADHLNIYECRFCQKRYNSSNDYLIHLRNDHGSNTTD